MTIRYYKHADQVQHPASLLKMMTALVARQWVSDADLDSFVLVDASDMHPPTTAQLQGGDQLSWRDLLFGLLVPSGNDAALAIARLVGAKILNSEGSGGEPRARFMQAMAAHAVALDLVGSIFETPHGGGGDTASLLSARHAAILLAECAVDQVLFTIMGAASHTMTITGANARTYQVNHTIDVEGPVSLPEFVMGKTGTHVQSGAGYCVALLWDKPGAGRRITVVMNSVSTNGRFLDARALMDYEISLPQ